MARGNRNTANETQLVELGYAETQWAPVPLGGTDWQSQSAAPSLALRGCTKALVGLTPLPAPWADDTDCCYGDLAPVQRRSFLATVAITTNEGE